MAAFEPTATAQEASLGRQFAEWTIPAAEAQQHFRRTSRARGLHFILPWPTTAPATTPIRITVQLTQFDGSAIETEALLNLTPHLETATKNGRPLESKAGRSSSNF